MCESRSERRGLFDSPASYQTVSRLQQLLSAQNTQALPFQLKGSLTKSEKEKNLPCQHRAGLPPAQGALRRVLHHPKPPVPGALTVGGAKSLLGARWPRCVSSSWPNPGVLGWFWGAPTELSSPCKPRLWGAGLGDPRGGWRWPSRGAASPAGSIQL